jgi:protein TonB
MSYSDERKGFSPASIGTVVAVHVAIGYAFISGLAYQVIQNVPVVTIAEILHDQEVPPPNEPPPPPQTRRTTTPPPVATNTIVDVPLSRADTVTTVDTVPLRPPVFEIPVPPQPQPRTQAPLTRGAIPVGDRAGWVTTDDYPTAALREGREGSVGIDVTIDEKGRVSNCAVTASSGSDLLDQATCRLYTRRARFTPALDDAGKPAVAHRADRVRWQIPS